MRKRFVFTDSMASAIQMMSIRLCNYYHYTKKLGHPLYTMPSILPSLVTLCLVIMLISRCNPTISFTHLLSSSITLTLYNPGHMISTYNDFFFFPSCPPVPYFVPFLLSLSLIPHGTLKTLIHHVAIRSLASFMPLTSMNFRLCILHWCSILNKNTLFLLLRLHLLSSYHRRLQKLGWVRVSATVRANL